MDGIFVIEIRILDTQLVVMIRWPTKYSVRQMYIPKDIIRMLATT